MIGSQVLNPERVNIHMLNAFSVNVSFMCEIPGLALRSNRWAVISQRLRRYVLTGPVASARTGRKLFA